MTKEYIAQRQRTSIRREILCYFLPHFFIFVLAAYFVGWVAFDFAVGWASLVSYVFMAAMPASLVAGMAAGTLLLLRGKWFLPVSLALLISNVVTGLAAGAVITALLLV